MQKTNNNSSPTQIAWRKLRSNYLATFGLCTISAFLLIAILGPFIRIDNSPKANQQQLELARKQPGFQINFIKVPLEVKFKKQSFFEQWIFGVKSSHKLIPYYDIKLKDDQLFVEKYTGLEPNNGEKLVFQASDFLTAKLTNEFVDEQLIVSKKFWLGTDRYGRDLLSRLMAGTWISFTVGFISILISLVIGISLGAAAGFFRGKLDDFIVWFINVVWSIPTLLLVIAITLALGKGFWQVFVAVGLTMWVEVARVVRGQVLSMREMEYVEAGKALGFRSRKIIVKHLLPNIMGPIIVISAANFAAAILIEAGLSFLGLGAQPPQATWGKMISEHKGYIITGDAFMAIFPGIAIFLLVLSFVLVGNGLRDAFDTKRSIDL
ncbi:MAG: ABC transporter permease [Vicingaceae bacterium]